MLSKFAVMLDEIRRAYERNAQRFHYHPDYTPGTAFTWVSTPGLIGSQDYARSLAMAMVGPHVPPPQSTPHTLHMDKQRHTGAIKTLSEALRPGYLGGAISLSAMNHPNREDRFHTQLDFDPTRDPEINAAAQHFQDQMRDRLDEHNRLHNLTGRSARHPRFYDFFVSDKPHAAVPSMLGLPNIQSALAQEAFDKIVALHEANELTAGRRGEGVNPLHIPFSRAWANSARRYGHVGARPWIGDLNLVNRLSPQQGLTQQDIDHLRELVLSMRERELNDLMVNTEPDALTAMNSLVNTGRASRHTIDAMNRLRARGLA